LTLSQGVINRNESFVQQLIFSIMKAAKKATKAAYSQNLLPAQFTGWAQQNF